MPFHRTDRGKINYPPGTSSGDRRFCRVIYDELYNLTLLLGNKKFAIACSGGLDSSALTHMWAHMCLIKGIETMGIVHVNHHLRPEEETNKDIDSIARLRQTLPIAAAFEVLDVEVLPGNTQEQARIARYDAMTRWGQLHGYSFVLAHHANDVAETKLFQLLSGREVSGMDNVLRWSVDNQWSIAYFHRPLLHLTRQELERYAKIWCIEHSEDSSNGTNKYTRNKIRHELIPWIEQNVNKNIVKALAKLPNKGSD